MLLIKDFLSIWFENEKLKFCIKGWHFGLCGAMCSTVRRCLHCSEITGCVLQEIIPLAVALFPQFYQAIIQQFNYLSIDKKKHVVVLSPMGQVTSVRTDLAVKFLNLLIPIMKSSSHVCFAKIVKVSSIEKVPLETPLSITFYHLIYLLTHLPLVPHICVNELDQHCFR